MEGSCDFRVNLIDRASHLWESKSTGPCQASLCLQEEKEEKLLGFSRGGGSSVCGQVGEGHLDSLLCHRLLLRENDLAGYGGMLLWFPLLRRPRQRKGLSVGPV